MEYANLAQNVYIAAAISARPAETSDRTRPRVACPSETRLLRYGVTWTTGREILQAGFNKTHFPCSLGTRIDIGID
jgi:hypothetical protein